TWGVPVRVALALSLLFGFFVLVVAVIGGALGLSIFAFTSSHAFAGIKLAAIGLVVAGALISALWKALQVKQKPGGVPLTRDQQPELWATIDELAAIAQTRGPDEVRLIPQVNAAVWEESSLFGVKS